MSNLEKDPVEVVCATVETDAVVEILKPRDVPLGGPRAMGVRRTLPQRRRSLIGAWCFLDHYGPDDVAATGGMVVPPHPHTGLQTVSWLFAGEIEHRDSAGSHAMVRPGELNLMTAGRGIQPSEVSTPSTTMLHGAQLLVTLPDATRHTPPFFEHYVPAPVQFGAATVRVFLGFLLGELVPAAHPGYLEPGRSTLRLEAGATPVRALLIGGAPLGERIVMWWNFIGRSHDEIVQFREE
jgi:redox-sensitive bicupin YhaK (pirin superfamily)